MRHKYLLPCVISSVLIGCSTLSRHLYTVVENSPTEQLSDEVEIWQVMDNVADKFRLIQRNDTDNYKGVIFYEEGKPEFPIIVRYEHVKGAMVVRCMRSNPVGTDDEKYIAFEEELRKQLQYSFGSRVKYED